MPKEGALSSPVLPQFLTVRTAAEFAECSQDTIRRLINRGELKAFRLGKSQVIRIRRMDLEKAFKPVTSLSQLAGDRVA